MVLCGKFVDILFAFSSSFYTFFNLRRDVGQRKYLLQ
jgi:hypothetical protein